MSTRWIAGIGLVLCVAMTSFSIYLGAVEHVYRPKAPPVRSLTAAPRRDFICQFVQFRHTTTTTTTATSGTLNVNAMPCVHTAPSSR
jgi:hypothetical protein